MTTVGKVNDISNDRDLEWKITTFSSLSGEKDKSYTSPLFNFANESWCLTIYPNGHQANYSNGYVGLYLTRKTGESPIKVEFTLGLKTLDGKKDQEKYFINNFKKANCGYGFPKCILNSALFKRKVDLLPTDVLTVFCNLHNLEFAENSSSKRETKCSYCKETSDAQFISVHKKCVDKPVKCPDCSDVVPLEKWLNGHKCQKKSTEGESSTPVSSVIPPKSKTLLDLKQLYLKQENCDVVLRVKGSKFSAHTAILTARSPVFAATFRNDMKEKETGIVEIDDCDPFSFSDFLCFLYCEEMEIICAENVFSLFIAADKYDVTDLRTKCLEFMKENISVDTFCETITIALQHTESKLLHSSTDFFLDNAEEIVETVKWQSFLDENPTESNELFIKYIKIVKHSKR